ncbi:M48 family metallopeptidase [Natrinema salaciae]|uniref:Heat shock protein HtpX n=1 Tax=Natrinema salaciae TaxID=1186196 RepID=A0A1H9Q759_9EURY|nr:M48 family metalloprotease [Natrinema salaciae]SER55683.1 heat shock protein HtpX [Natrinema salaciae]
MRLRSTIGLAGRAVGAGVIGLGTLVGLGLALAAIGGVCFAAFGVIVADQVIDPGFGTLAVGFAAGTILSFGVWMAGVRKAIRSSRRELLRNTEPIDLDENGRIGAATRRTAATFGLPMPKLRHHPASTPIACTTSYDGEPIVVVSDGLLETLSDAELEAVVAHELAHLSNGDHRLMTWMLVPLVASEEFYEMMHEEDEFDPRVLPWLAIGRLLIGSSALGVGLFSRGREFAADRAAVAATGDPAALAAALERLDSSAGGRPPEDLRKHARSLDAMSVLPTLDPECDGGGGLFATHPATERRLERLRRLAAA